jgi:hypothetical protein
MGNFPTHGNLLLSPFNGLPQWQMAPEDDSIGLFQGADRSFGEMMSFQAHQIQAKKLGPITGCGGIGRNILRRSRRTPQDGVASHADELVNRHQTADHGVIFNQNMASQGRPVGHDHLIPDFTVMGNVRISHDKISIADSRGSSPIRRPPVDGYELANHVSGTDGHPRRLASVPKRLGRRTHGNKGKNAAILSDLSQSIDDHVGIDVGILSDPHMLPNGRKRSNFNPRADLGSGMNDGLGMNFQSSLLIIDLAISMIRGCRARMKIYSSGVKNLRKARYGLCLHPYPSGRGKDKGDRWKILFAAVRFSLI